VAGETAARKARLPILPRVRLNGWTLLALPAALFLLAFFGYPLVEMALQSLDPSAADNYRIFVDSPVYARTLRVTFQTAFIVTIVCLLLGYPYAYVMHQAGPRLAAIMLFSVMLPFWSSLLVRTYAWTVWLQDTGVINSILRDLGLIEAPIQLMRNTLGVTIGISQILLPFMVLPIYAVMRRIDPELSPAAASLGAPPFAAFRRVFFPLTLPGVLAGSLIVFVLTLGFYITPALLGSPRNAMLSELIVDQVSEQRNFGVGAALGIVLLGLTVAVLLIGTRIVPLGRTLGYEDER
jgi:putative spermidine/putrescine transport system permease protein